MSTVRITLFTGLLLFAFMSLRTALAQDPSCQDSERYQFACGLVNPEDLGYYPPGKAIIFSRLDGDGEANGGSLGALDPESMQPLSLSFSSGEERWGDPGCEALPAVNAHGLDLRQRSDGRWQLLAVNHVGRESIEFYELHADSGGIGLSWRGCVAGDSYSFFNDVVALPGGGFLVSQMMPNPDTWRGKLAMLMLLLGADAGAVMRWSPQDGELVALEGVAARMPNGLSLSADATTLYINSYIGNEVLQLDLQRHVQRSLASVRYPDNASWGEDGRLLVASQLSSFREALDCQQLQQQQPGASCLLPFEIVAIDPQSGDRELLFTSGGHSLPVATVALQVGSDLFLGTYGGDRIVKLRNILETAVSSN